MTIGSSVYIGTDGTGPGGQWVRTRSGWRLSESDDTEPSKEEVADVLGKHIKRESNKYIMQKAEGITGAPPSRAGPSENLAYLPIMSRTTPEAGYTTLGEAIRRLNFVDAVGDAHKFNYVFRVVEMTVKHKLLSLSGSSIRRLFAIIQKMIDEMEARSHFDRRLRLDHTLKLLANKLKTFVKELSCSHSAISACIAKCTELRQRLKALNVSGATGNNDDDDAMIICDLPMEVQDKIMLSLNSLSDLDAMSATAPMFAQIAEEYKKTHLLNMIESNWDEESCRDWKLPKWKSNAPIEDSLNLDSTQMRLQYNRLMKKHGLKETFPIQLVYCVKTCVLYWQDGVNPFATNQQSNATLTCITPDSFVMTFFEQNK